MIILRYIFFPLEVLIRILSCLFEVFKYNDPLIIYDKHTKSRELQNGISAIEHYVFVPSILSFSSVTHGNGQNFIGQVKEFLYEYVVGPFKFDRRSILKLSDGGQIQLEYKWHGDYQGSDPILVVVPGFIGESNLLYVQNILNEGFERGFNVILINWRGLGGAPLTSPKIYSVGSSPDIAEAIMHIHEIYPQSDLYGYGISLGGGMICNAMASQGQSCPLKAAALISPPIKFDGSTIRHNCYGFYNYILGVKYHKLYSDNLDIMVSELRKFDIDLEKYLKENTPDFLNFNDKIVAKLEGYKNIDELFQLSCINQLNQIKVPTFFLRPRDDPIMDQSVSQNFENNPNIVLGSTNYGGHGAYNDHLWSWDQWSNKPILDFLCSFWQTES